jgi:hypothetical protein
VTLFAALLGVPAPRRIVRDPKNGLRCPQLTRHHAIAQSDVHHASVERKLKIKLTKNDRIPNESSAGTPHHGCSR